MGQNMVNGRRSTFESTRRVLIILPLKKNLFSKARMERTDLEEHQRNQENMKIIKILMCIIGNFAFICLNLCLIHLHWTAPSCVPPASFNLLMQLLRLICCFYFRAIWNQWCEPLGFIGVFLEVFRDVHFLVKY